MGLVTTTNYDQINAIAQKEPIIVLEIEGVPYIFGSNQVYTQIRYDDVGVFYDGTYAYDGLRPLDPDHARAYIDRKKSFSTISQKLEQWDGKASIETFNISIIDKDGLLTDVCTPGKIIPDIINAKVKVYFGYKVLSFPEDYLLLFKGYVNKYDLAQGFVNFLFTDPSSKRKQSLFSAVKLTVTSDINPGDTIINLTSTDSLYRSIPNAKGAYDTTYRMGLVIDNEIMTYTNADILSTTQLQVTRGQFTTVADTHSAGTTTEMFIHFTDNPISIALKCMLSGWGGSPWVSDIPLRGIVNLDNGLTEADTITFAQGVDLVRDYGLTAGDFVTLSGSPNPTSNVTFTILDFVNDNRSILVAESGILIQEDPPGAGGYLSTTAAFNSKYDVYPKEAGLQLTTDDVLVSQHEYVRQTFIQTTFKLPVKGEESNGKTFIETDLFKSVGAYSLTQGAKISVGCTHPPLSTDLTKFLDHTNVINAKNIVVTRGVDTRFFYNEITFNYNYDVVQGKFNNVLIVQDAESQDRLNQTSSLQIDVKGYDSNASSVTAMKARANRLLQRYRFSAETIKLETQFGVGHTIDAGDVVVLTDATPPVLQIANTLDGSRGVYSRIMEVQERSIDLGQGITKIVLLSNNGFALTDRYGVIGPSSNLDPSFAHTSSKIKIIESFFTTTAEYEKWSPYDGYNVKVFNDDYTLSASASFTLDPANEYIMNLSPALPFTPTSSFHVQFEDYNATSSSINSLAKAQFVYFDPTSPIFSASSSTVFVLQSGYSSRFQVGQFIYVQSPDCVRSSPDVKIISIAGDVITIGAIASGGATDLGFTPQPGDFVELTGFRDGGAGYRLI